MVTQQAGSLAGFDHSMFTHDGRAHEVFRAGTGPAVIVIHEMPGLHPGVVEFAQRLIDAGYTVFLPSLFGRPGERSPPHFSHDDLHAGRSSTARRGHPGITSASREQHGSPLGDIPLNSGSRERPHMPRVGWPPERTTRSRRRPARTPAGVPD